MKKVASTANVIRDATASLNAVSTPHTSAAIKESTAVYADCSLQNS